MKANELMIGNLVYNPFTRKILRLTFGRDLDLAEELCLEPIPLTAEILEKNGFIHRITDVDGDMYTYKWHIEQQDKVLQHDHYFHVTADPYEGSGFYWLPEMSAVVALHFRYVHELQNIMRMVGINENITL